MKEYKTYTKEAAKEEHYYHTLIGIAMAIVTLLTIVIVNAL